MRQLAWAFALGLVAATAVTAAPAPRPRLATAEAVLRVSDAEALRAVTARLRSRPLLSDALRRRGQLPECVKDEPDPVQWLTSRLEVSGDEKGRTLTLRLVNCPRKDAVALLGDVLRVYQLHAEGDRMHNELIGGEMQARQQVVLRVRRLGARRAPPVQVLMREYEGGLRSHRGAVPVTVVKPPRLVFGR